MPTREKIEAVLLDTGAVVVDVRPYPERFEVVIDVAGHDMAREEKALEGVRPAAARYRIRWRRARWWHRAIA